MSNLSELIPAGSGAKVAEFVASGTVASGTPVILNANGTVTQVAQSAISAAVGTAANTVLVSDIAVAYDSTNNKVLLAYRDNNTGKGMAQVGTINGTSISYGTAFEFAGSIAGDSYRRIGICFNSTEGKFVIVYRDSSINNSGRAITATISGTSVSFGSSAVFTSDVTNSQACSFDSASNKVVIVYANDSDGNDGYGVVATLSGTSLSFGTPVEFNQYNTSFPVPIYDSNANKTVIVYRDQGASNLYNGIARVATVSGTSISYGSAATFNAASTEMQSGSFDSVNNKIVVCYTNNGNSGYGTAIVGTVSGTSISFGTAAVFQSSATGLTQFMPAYNVAAGKTVIGYGAYNGSAWLSAYVEATVSGTSLSFNTPAPFAGSNKIDRTPAFAAYDSSGKQVVIAYREAAASSELGTAVVVRSAYTTTNLTATNFIGITNAAISNSATGEVAVQGGVATNPTGPYALTVGSPNQFTSSTLTDPYTQVVYDSSNNKIVVLYRDSSNSDYGTAIVGTVSGTSISYGSPVIFEAAQSVLISATYDSNSNKVVVCYRDGGNSSYGTAIVGTVSGTSISFGTAAVFQSSSVSYVSSVQDSDTNKTIIAYRDNGNSNHGKSIVGTVSGTSISFGSAATFASSAVQYVSIGYDATNSRAVIAYERSAGGVNGRAIVGTVSGTSISFGSEATFQPAYETRNTTTTFDPSSGKVLISYNYYDTVTGSYAGVYGIVGTVSGTSISFGSRQYAFGVGYAQAYTGAVYDPDINKIILVASTAENSYAGGSIVATISGTSVSFGAFKLFDSSRTNYNSIAYDTTSNKSIIAYGADTNGGECVVGTASTAVILTIGTDYFVQTDGTLSTTTSTVPAGRALSATSILLEG